MERHCDLEHTRLSSASPAISGCSSAMLQKQPSLPPDTLCIAGGAPQLLRLQHIAQLRDFLSMRFSPQHVCRCMSMSCVKHEHECIQKRSRCMCMFKPTLVSLCRSVCMHRYIPKWCFTFSSLSGCTCNQITPMNQPTNYLTVLT